MRDVLFAKEFVFHVSPHKIKFKFEKQIRDYKKKSSDGNNYHDHLHNYISEGDQHFNFFMTLLTSKK